MTNQILTEVTARVDPARDQELLDGFHELLRGPVPDGLLRTELLRGDDGDWRIQTLWASREALEAMRAAAEPPAAPTLLRSVGAEPRLTILEVSARHQAPHA
jgi:heme-degrading monooxygenase HmoA